MYANNRGVDHMKLDVLIKERVSQKTYIEKEVDLNLIKELINVAIYAPNHKMREPWDFLFMDKKGKQVFKEAYLNTLSDIKKEDIEPKLDKIYKAPLLMFVLMNTSEDFDQELEDLQANAAMIQNFMLLAEEKGISTHWKTPGFIKTDNFKEVLNLPLGYIITGIIMIGYADQKNRPKERKTIETLNFYKG